MKTKEFNTGPGIFLISYQIMLLLALPFCFYYIPPSIPMIVISVVLLYCTGMSITGGYHRLYSHKSYSAHPIVESILLFFGSMAIQGSALRWSYDHRLHHAYVDTDKDPYSIKKGFWYAHFMWMLEKPAEIEPRVVKDLMANKLVAFQHKYGHALMLTTNILAFLFVGWLLNDYVGAFIYAGWLRIFALHHFTWFINSLAHTWGDKPFCQEQTAVNNFVVALLTFGEGYHNYHHTFANDYRNGIRWYHFDPTKWLIWTLNKLGLAHQLKVVDPVTISKKMVTERKNLLLNKICDLWYVQKEELENKIKEASDRLIHEISALHQAIENYRSLVSRGTEKSLLTELQEEIDHLKKSLKEDWKNWMRLSKDILKMRPLPVPN